MYAVEADKKKNSCIFYVLERVCFVRRESEAPQFTIRIALSHWDETSGWVNSSNQIRFSSSFFVSFVAGFFRVFRFRHQMPYTQHSMLTTQHLSFYMVHTCILYVIHRCMRRFLSQESCDSVRVCATWTFIHTVIGYH